MKNRLIVLAMLVMLLTGSLMVAVNISLVASSPISKVDYESAVIKAADRLVALQSTTDYGWDWVVTGLTAHSPNPSAPNLYGVTALGLLDAYQLTGNVTYFNAAKAVADYLVSLGSGTYHYQFDLEFLIKFAEISGDTTYYTFASEVWTWMKANIDRYADGHQVDLYNYYYTRYGESQGAATWATGDWAIAALELGDTIWAKAMTDVIKANCTKMEPDLNEYQYVGWGKALKAFQAVDPEAYSSEIVDIVNILKARQQADGSFTGWVQDEAYVIMGLVSVGEIEMAENASTWLIENQGYGTIVGGWKLPDGNEYSEVTSEAGQAIFRVIQAIGTVCVDHGSNGTIDLKTMTIQQAINAAYSGDTIIVNPGTYREALYVDKSLILKGLGSPTIEAPDTVPLRQFTGPSGTQRSRPIIFVYGEVEVTIDGFIIDGRGVGNTNYGFIGIQYFGASGEIKNNTIKAIRDTPLSGAQHGNAIVVNHLWDQYCSHSVTIINNVIFDFQKNGITCNEPGTYAIVRNNIITGAGLTDKIAQNGIQFGWNATGVIEANIVSGHKYTNVASWWSCGILLYLYSNGTVVHYNTVADNNAGVFVYSSSNVIVQYNNVYGNTEYGVYNEPSALVDARFNWWGNATGPYHPTLNPRGTGDAVSDDVNFDHWLLEKYPTSLLSPVIYIDPAEIEYWTLACGKTFEVNVKIDEVTKLAGYEFKLYWDTNLLDLVDIKITPPWPEGNYMIAKNYTDESAGLYWLGVGSYMTGPFTGSTTLATLTFKITYDPVYPENKECALNLENTKLSAPAGDPIYHIAHDGKYSIFSTRPKIEVKPSTYTAHSYEEIFTVDIYVSDIVDLYNYTFKLHYDTTLLDAVNLEIGSFLKPPIYVYKFIVDDANGEIWLWVWSTSGTPVSGSGVLATITFKVTKATTWTKYHPNILECSLDLYDTMLITDKGIEVPHDVVDGTYRYEPKPGDLNCDGQVGLVDLRIVAYYYDPAYNPIADLNEDGSVDIYDLQIVAYYYGEDC